MYGVRKVTQCLSSLVFSFFTCGRLGDHHRRKWGCLYVLLFCAVVGSTSPRSGPCLRILHRQRWRWKRYTWIVVVVVDFVATGATTTCFFNLLIYLFFLIFWFAGEERLPDPVEVGSVRHVYEGTN